MKPVIKLIFALSSATLASGLLSSASAYADTCSGSYSCNADGTCWDENPVCVDEPGGTSCSPPDDPPNCDNPNGDFGG